MDDLTRQIAELKASTAAEVGAGHDTARTTAATTMANKKSSKDALLDRITGSGGAAAPKAGAPAADKFTVGKVYTDAAGNKATYKGAGQWEPVQEPVK